MKLKKSHASFEKLSLISDDSSLGLKESTSMELPRNLFKTWASATYFSQASFANSISNDNKFNAGNFFKLSNCTNKLLSTSNSWNFNTSEDLLD